MLRAVWSVDPLPAAWHASRKANPLQHLARHEAGHVVVMAALGVPGLSASISDAGSAGAAVHQARAVEAPASEVVAYRRAGALAAAAIFHAGIEAELLAVGLASPPGIEWRLTATTDHSRADEVLREFFHVQPHGFAKAFARAVISRNLDSLDRIARHMERTGAWHPDDTQGLVINCDGAFEALVDACLRYEAE